MKADSGHPRSTPPRGKPVRQGIFSWPSTRLGWWSFGLGAVFEVLSMINTTVFMPRTVPLPWGEELLPFYGILMLSCGLAAGIVGLMAIIRRGERSFLVWLSLLPALFVLLLILGEFLVPH